MPGLFQGLEIGKRALSTYQVWLQTIGHNIANVNTPGYSRQRVTISPTMPEDWTVAPVGTGVQADDVRHVRDLFLSEQYRDASKSLGQWSSRQKTLSQIESLVNEPNDNSLGDLLNEFWDSWSELSTNPDSTSNRVNILSQANKLVSGFNQLAQKLTGLRDGIDRDLSSITTNINLLTSEIAKLNNQIAAMELGGNTANDLRDQRDQLTDELSKIIDVHTVQKPNGSTIVQMGAMVLVDGADSIDLDVTTVNRNGQSTHALVWKGTTTDLTNLNGELYGLLVSRDQVIPGYLDQLNDLAQALVQEVNTLHMSGHDMNGAQGIEFFDPTSVNAATIKVNNLIQNNSSRIVASTGTDSDNLIALAMVQLRDKPVLNKNSVTMTDFYNGLVGKLGIESNQAKSFSGNYELLAQQVDNARQSVQGVSLDEEMTNMIKYQHAYDAAARVITAMDQALDTVIHGLGVVGR